MIGFFLLNIKNDKSFYEKIVILSLLFVFIISEADIEIKFREVKPNSDLLL